MLESARKLGVVTGVVLMGMAVGAWAGTAPEAGNGTEERCSGGAGTGEQGPARRPRAFEPQVVGFAGAQGFAVSGCFPQNCPEPLKVQETAAGPKVADELTPCATRVMEVFGLSLAHVQHPPLTPEERNELVDTDQRCQQQGGRAGAEQTQRVAELKEKQRRFRDVKHEVRMMVNVGMGFFAVDHFELSANQNDGGGTHCERIGENTMRAQGWRPWLQMLTPVKLVAQLRPVTASPGSQPVEPVVASASSYLRS